MNAADELRILGQEIIVEIEREIRSPEIADQIQSDPRADIKGIAAANLTVLESILRYKHDAFEKLEMIKTLGDGVKKHLKFWASKEKQTFLDAIKEHHHLLRNLIQLKKEIQGE